MRKLLKDLRAACNSPFWEKLPHKNRFFRWVTDLPFLFTFFSRYIQSRTCSGRRTQHLLIRATGSDYEVSYPWVAWIWSVSSSNALVSDNETYDAHVLASSKTYMRAACNSPFWEKLPNKNRFFRWVTDLPFLFTFFSRYIQSRTCSGRRIQHLLIRATGSDYEVSYPWVAWIWSVSSSNALVSDNETYDAHVLASSKTYRQQNKPKKWILNPLRYMPFWQVILRVRIFFYFFFWICTITKIEV